MENNLSSRSSIEINATPQQIWEALLDPEVMKSLFGAEMEADWRVGGKVTYSGMWEGKPYSDKGEILIFDAPRVLSLNYFSPLMGKEDVPENYQEVRYEINDLGNGNCTLTITQGNIDDQDGAEKAEQNWNYALEGIKKLVEENKDNTDEGQD